MIFAIFRAHAEGARIINMSFMGKVERDSSSWDGVWLDSLEVFESDTVWLHNGAGRLLFAAAGNDSENIDATNAHGEAFWHYPCENQGVICVGGWRDDGSPEDGKVPDPGSNFSTGGGEVIDIWGPWCARVGDDLTTQGAEVFTRKCGTSFATPVVAGVAALIWAANPALSNDQVWDLMNKHAIQGGPLVRRVHAFRAVREALMSTGVNSKPWAAILGNATLSQAGTTSMSVSAYDVEDETCCAASWTLNGQPAGSGGVFKHDFGADPLGTKAIEVVITDSGGKTATAFMTATLSNAPPTVKITDGPTTSVPQGMQTGFRAVVLDDTLGLDLPDSGACPSLTWTSSNDPGVLGTGCEPVIAFGSPGGRTVTATATDKRGAKGTASWIVNVVTLPSSQLVASIVSPKSDFGFPFDHAIAPQAQVLQASGRVTTSWTLTSHSTGNTRTIQLKEINGAQAFTLGEVFPELRFLQAQQSYTLAVRLTTRSGQIATASVEIGQLTFIK
jgi:serine protease